MQIFHFFLISTRPIFSAVNGELIDNIKILDHLSKLLETNLAIVVLVCLNDSSVNQLLKLNIVKIGTDHHFEDLEKFTIADVAVIVDIIDLESESKFLLLGRSSGKRVKTLDEFQEGNTAVLVFVENLDDSLNQWIVSQL